MGLLALWLTAFAGIVICRRSLQLAEAMRTLHQEIAQRQQTELALRQSEERLRVAVQGAGMGAWDVNLQTGRVVWSESHFRMLGYQPTPGGEASREMWQSRVHPEDEQRVLEAYEHARRNHTLHSPEYRIRRADTDEIVWVAVFGRCLYDEAGNAVRFVGVSFDITRRKELEREVLEIAAREQRRIGQELHDGVGQELTGLGLMANALAQHLQSSTTEQRIAARLFAGLDRVHQQVRSLSHGLVPVQVEANGLWAALDDLAASTSQQSGVPVAFDCPERIDVADHATATQLYRIAQEALSNALRHSQARKVCLTLQSAPHGLRLSVQDDGSGIAGPPEENHGMGLRIMRYRAEQIGGTLHIEPADGGGTVVTCVLSRRNGHDGDQAGDGNGRRENSDRGRSSGGPRGTDLADRHSA